MLKAWNADKEHALVTFLIGKLFNHAVAFKNKDQIKEYFELTSEVLKKTSPQVIEKVYKNEVKGLTIRLFDLIKKERSEESS